MPVRAEAMKLQNTPNIDLQSSGSRPSVISPVVGLTVSGDGRGTA